MAYTTVSTQNAIPRGIAFSSDGTLMFELGALGGSYVYEYDLSTAWDLSTASYNSVVEDFATTINNVNGIEFSADGTKLYLVGNDNVLYQLDLSTAWDITSATDNSVTLSLEDSAARGVTFSSNGTTMIEVGLTSDLFYEYTLSTAWVISSATYNSVSESTEGATPNDVMFNDDGSKMYELDTTTQKLYQYEVSTAYDITTADYTTDSINADLQGSSEMGGSFSSDGTKFYEINTSDDKVYQHFLTTAWDVSTATDAPVPEATANVEVTATATPTFYPHATASIEVTATATAYIVVVEATASIEVTATATAKEYIPIATASIEVTATGIPVVYDPIGDADIEVTASATAYQAVANAEMFTFVYSIQQNLPESTFRFVYSIEQPKTTTIIERVNI